jgi:hypothetical protein
MSRPFEIQKQETDPDISTYPLNKETARILLDMTSHPGWSIFLECLEFEAEVYKKAALSTDYGPNALEKFRFNQALAVNIPRIPRAILEAVDAVLDEDNSLDSLYDALHLNV